MRRMTVTLPLADAASKETDKAMEALGELLKPGGTTPDAVARVKSLARKAQQAARKAQ